MLDLVLSRGGFSWFGGFLGYETAALLVVSAVLFRMRRRQVPDATVFGAYLLMAGTVRFLIEFVRVNLPIAGPFTLAQLIAAAIVCVGGGVLARARTT